MLGKSHMAIGAGTACLLAPFILQLGNHPIGHDIITGNWVVVMHAAEIVLAAILGSVTPDLDESHSLLAQKIEMVGKLLLIAALLLVTMWAHVVLSPLGWAVWAIMAFSLLSQANRARKIALVFLASGALYVLTLSGLSSLGGIGLALWCMGAAFSAHRTWTHSLAGMVCLLPAEMWMLGHGLSFWAIGFFIGYTLHLMADSVSGGVPLFYPMRKKRMGIRLVHTGGGMDRTISAGMILIALLAVFN